MPIDKSLIVSAVDKAKSESKKRNFKQAIELIVALRDIDMKKPENRINEILELPHPPELKKVCVFATGELALASRKVADLVLDRENIEKLSANKKEAKKLAREYDFFIAEASLMPLIGRSLGPFLGPRGKMPTPVSPNVEISHIVNKYKRMVRLRTKDTPVVQCKVGTEEMGSGEVADNILAVLNKLESKLGAAKYIGKIYVKTTMGSTIRVK